MSDTALTTLPQLAEAINAEHEHVTAAFKTGLEHARKAGELLVQAKGQVEHGQWLPWLEKNCNVTPRMAQNYMRVAENWAELAKYETVSHLGLRDALKMLAHTPEEEDSNRTQLKIADIDTSFVERYRKDLGDLKPLARSIKELDLLHAIGVTKDGNKLVFGLRRLRAVEMNGDKTIACQMLEIDDEYDMLKVFMAENMCREDYRLSELVDLADEFSAVQRNFET